VEATKRSPEFSKNSLYSLYFEFAIQLRLVRPLG
jgi:hypothetical protein